MANRRRRSRILFWAILASLACDVEELSTLEVVVRVDAPAQAAALPAQVLVGFDSGGSGYVVFRVGFLCGPPGAPFATTARFTETTGDGPSAVDAWVAPLDPGAPFACGPVEPQRLARPPPRSEGVSRATARAEVLGGCGSGEARAAVVVIG